MEHKGPLKVSRGSKTRAEFLAMLCAKVKTGGGIDFVSAELTVKEPVGYSAGLAKTNVKTGLTKITRSTHASKKKSKAQGVAVGSDITVKGVKATSAQCALLERLLDVAAKLSASPKATQAMICAAIGESTVSLASNGNYWGVLQGAVGTWKRDDVEGMATSFLVGGKGYQGGGAISLALSNPTMTPGTIAYTVEGDISNFTNASQAENFYGQWLAEANAIIGLLAVSRG